MLLRRIKDDLDKARKDRDQNKLTVLTTLYSESAMIGKNEGNRESTDEEVTKVIKKFVKNSNEMLDLLNKSNKPNSEVQYELEIYNSYLPKQLSESQLKEIIYNLIEKVGKSPKSIGIIMKELKEQYNGLYDGKIASNMIKDLLT